MEKFGDDFLKEKYWANEKFRKATEVAALRTQKRTGERIPNNPSDRIENYLTTSLEVWQHR